MDEKASDYRIDRKFLDKNRHDRFLERHPREVASCWDTLDNAASLLSQGLPLGTFSAAAIRSEGKNLWRVGPKGSRRGRAEIRLYFYFYRVGKVLYPLTFGDKSTQEKDIRRCRSRIEKLFQ